MKLHRKIASWFGYELIKLKKHSSASSHLVNLIQHYNIDVVLDVGANYGQFGLMLRDLGYQGTIHSFEPVSSTFATLKQASAQDTRWHVHQLALAEQAGEMTINVAESSDLSSFLAANEFGQSQYQQIDKSRKENVKVSTIDLFFADHRDEFEDHNILLKMDTQGYDLNVFNGAKASTYQIALLLSELSFINIYEGMPDYQEVLQTYQQQGFAVSGFYPISRKDNLSVIEMDAMFINTRLEQRKNFSQT